MEKTFSKDWYISNFAKLEESLNGESKSEFHNVRKNALELFGQTGFPTVKMEDWKYTDVSPIFEHEYNYGELLPKVSHKDVEKFKIENLNAVLLVFVNGKFNEKLSSFINGLVSLGVKIGSLAYWMKQEPELVLNHLSKYAKMPNGFAALNTAFTVDGAFIYIPDNVVIKDPIHIMNLHGAENSKILSQPRNLIIAGKTLKQKLSKHITA